MMDTEQILFYIMGFIALASALVVAASKNLVRSLFMFFVTLFALAGLYVFASADFVAVTQVVIYVGGVLVLMLFAFMLSNREVLNQLKKGDSKFISLSNLPALLVAVLFFVILTNAVLKAKADDLPWIKTAFQQGHMIEPGDNQIGNIGINLMTSYLLPFEIVSILLMMTLIGAAHLARKEEHKL